jgi:aryl-alcohol dehydrogenase-like predicted oxidoreductase
MIPTMPFGATGHDSSRILFGAAALWPLEQDEADRVLATLLEAGINHIDVAASYGAAEDRVGPWMREHRERFFLATKTGDRGYAEARASIHRSLERLETDHLDLIQLHNLTDDEGFEQAFSEDGALRACVEARDEGLVRFIGVTGHGTRVADMHLASLERFPFDSVLLPYNFSLMSQPDYAASFEELLRVCQQRNVAVQTIKAIARRRWQQGEKRTTTTWYHAFEDPADVERAVHYALARPGIFLNTASDPKLLAMTLDAAETFRDTPSSEDMAELEARLSVQPLFIPGHDGVGRAW